MKKTFLLLLLFGLFSLQGEAQILKNQKKRAEERAKNRTERKAQNKVDQKVDKAVDDAFNKIGGLFKKKNKKQSEDNSDYDDEELEETESDRSGFGSMMMGKSAGDLGLPDSYTFSTFVDMQFTSTNKRGKEDSYQFKYLFPTDDAAYMGYQMENIVSGIVDRERMKVVSVMPDQNMATSMDMETVVDIAADYKEEEPLSEDYEDFKLTKTGESKTIAGYTCDQYLIESTEMEGDLWVANDFDRKEFRQMSAGMSQMMQQNKALKLPEEYVEIMGSGFMFEGTFKEKGSKEQTHMVVKEVGNDQTDISLQGYRVMDMSKFMKKR